MRRRRWPSPEVPAADYDINKSSAEGGDHAEKRALPLTLAILILAFGTLIAAALPFMMGLATTQLSLGLAFVLAQLMPVSNLLGNVVTMIGLAVGIDYSLLMVKEYRERLRHSQCKAAVAETVAGAGATILWSGSTVAIGLLGLPVEPHSGDAQRRHRWGVGGAGLGAAPRSPCCPRVSPCWGQASTAGRFFGAAAHSRPQPRARAAGSGSGEWIVRRPLRTFAAAMAVVVVLALPVFGARSGFSNESWFMPKNLESRVGADLLSAQRSDDATLVVRAVLRTTDGEPVFGGGPPRRPRSVSRTARSATRGSPR